MKQPDRFARDAHRAVQQLIDGGALDLTAASLTMIQGAESVVVALLRRQHAAYVRLVKQQPGTLGRFVDRDVLLAAVSALLKKR